MDLLRSRSMLRRRERVVPWTLRDKEIERDRERWREMERDGER